MTPEQKKRLKGIYSNQKGPKDQFKETQTDASEKYSKIGTMHSVLAGVGSGLISIPKGLFSLGATLMDLGSDTKKAVEVEKWFDDLTEWDEKAEATAAGKITEALVNLGIPGGVAFTKGAKLAQSALQSKKLGKYFVLNNSNLVKAAGKAQELNAKGRTAKFFAAATSGGLAESVFVGDVEQIGSFGDLLGGPTRLERDKDYDPERELINRIKFGTEGALFTGVIGGVGHTLKSLSKRSRMLRNSHRKEDRLMDAFASKLRARGKRPEAFFKAEMIQRGLRDADINVAQNVSRELDKNIDAVFGLVKPFFDPLKRQARAKTLTELNDALMSGTPKVTDLAKGGVRVSFDNIRPDQWGSVVKRLKDNGATDEAIEKIFGNLNAMRTGWGEMFSALGGKLEGGELTKFKSIFGDRFKKYFEQTYEAFQKKTLIPFLGYKPAREVIDQAREFIMDVAAKSGRTLTKGEADMHIEAMYKGVKAPREISDKIDPYFEVPDFFVKDSVLAKENVKHGTASVSDFVTQYKMGNGKVVDPKDIVEKILGKNKNPLQTMLSATGRMSLITRRNEFFRDVLKQSDEIAKGIDPQTGKNYEKLFYNSADEAKAAGIFDTKRIASLDPGGKLDIGVGNPLLNKYAIPEVIEALEETAKNTTSLNNQIYASLVLYPKATSQIAKTILSPVTHVRNFVSASMFATANGIIPNAEAIKMAYSALQTPLKGTRQQNDLYRKLLKLGVVNSNVRLGDIQNLMKDVKWGETMSSMHGLKGLLKPLSKIKKVSEDLYTAEDDFWKIASWATEKSRLGAAYKRAGIEMTEEALEQEAAHIVKHQIPNYAYVSDFVKGLRKWPIGNFVSFPSEIMRTSTNIARRALHEINYTVKVGGKDVKPLRGIGYKRLIGMGATMAAVPAAATKLGQMIYNVTEDEMEALRRYVADWSKNSTLFPIKTEDGKLKYIDVSHANAYDTVVRPFQTLINEVGAGRDDEDGMMDDFMRGLFKAGGELMQPFVSESIFTEAALDIITRKGRSREGYEIYNEDDLAGTKMTKIMNHLVKTQIPFSWEQLKRLDVAIKPVDVIQDRPGPYDEYGQAFEVGDEALGFMGLRIVDLNPERGLNFKIADFQRTTRNAGRVFKRPSLKGGIVTPEEIVQAYIDANKVLYKGQREMMKDLEGAKTLKLENEKIDKAFERISRKAYYALDEGEFRPLFISRSIQEAFEDNAAKLGVDNPFIIAEPIIDKIRDILSIAPLAFEFLPEILNPLKGTRKEAGAAAATQANINLQTPEVDPNLITPQFNTANIGGANKANLVQTGNVMQNGLTQTEMALLSDEEKVMRLRQRGIA